MNLNYNKIDLSYWEDVMKHRMPKQEEVWRLETILKGNLYDHNNYALECNRPEEIMTPYEFWDTKRPYGNKDIEASIAFNLGWDYKRVLCHERMPEFVRKEAMELHDLLRQHLIENEE